MTLSHFWTWQRCAPHSELEEFEPPAWPVHLVVPTTRYMPRAVRAFLDVAAPALSHLRAIHE
jgi:DNA-binding transcriptional LysR family regulator